MNEITVKAIDFSVLQVGEKFFVSKQNANDGSVYCIKTETNKAANGGWTNAKTPSGLQSFIRYDSRVWVRK